MELGWAYYQLEVAAGADRAVVQAAYHRLARAWHPDHHHAEPARAHQGAERLRSINAAYATLRSAGFPGPPPPRAAHSPTPPAWSPPPTPPWSASWPPPPPPRASPPPHAHPTWSPAPAAARPRPAPASRDPDDVSLFWALLWLVVILLTLGALSDHDDG